MRRRHTLGASRGLGHCWGVTGCCWRLGPQSNPWLCPPSRVSTEPGITLRARAMHLPTSVQLSSVTGAQDQQRGGGSQGWGGEWGRGQWRPWDMHGAGEALEVPGKGSSKAKPLETHQLGQLRPLRPAPDSPGGFCCRNPWPERAAAHPCTGPRMAEGLGVEG